MCFSAEASFIVGSALIPAGGYCLWAAAVKRPSYLGLACVPFFCGIQQISEGFVWLADPRIETQPDPTRTPSLVFLFFALAFWPLWFSVVATLMEPESKRRWLLAALSLLSFSWFWILYYPLLVGEVDLKTQVVHHSIQYQYDGLPIYRFVDRWLLRVLYLLSIGLPLMLSSLKWSRFPGVALGVLALFTMIVYRHAFVSVWCFFAAVTAAYCCTVFYQLPRPTPSESVPATTGGV